MDWAVRIDGSHSTANLEPAQEYQDKEFIDELGVSDASPSSISHKPELQKCRQPQYVEGPDLAD